MQLVGALLPALPACWQKGTRPEVLMQLILMPWWHMKAAAGCPVEQQVLWYRYL